MQHKAREQSCPCIVEEAESRSGTSSEHVLEAARGTVQLGSVATDLTRARSHAAATRDGVSRYSKGESAKVLHGGGGRVRHAPSSSQLTHVSSAEQLRCTEAVSRKSGSLPGSAGAPDAEDADLGSGSISETPRKRTTGARDETLNNSEDASSCDDDDGSGEDAQDGGTTGKRRRRRWCAQRWCAWLARCRVSVLAVFGVLIVASILLPGTFSLVPMVNSVRRLLRDTEVVQDTNVVREIAALVAQRIVMTESTALAQKQAFVGGLYDTANRTTMLLFFHDMLSHYTSSSSLFHVQPNGAFYGILRDRAGGYVMQYWFDNGTLCEMGIDPSTMTPNAPPTHCMDNYNASHLDWYAPFRTGHVAVNQSWTHLYKSMDVYVSFVVVAWGRNGVNMGSFGCDFLIGSVDPLVSNSLANSDMLFFVEADTGALIYASDPSVPVGAQSQGRNNNSLMYCVSEVDNRWIRAADRALSASGLTWAQVGNRTLWGEGNVLVSVATIQRTGLTWAIVSVNECHIYAVTTHTVVTLVVLVCICIGVGVGMMTWSLRPLTTLSKSMTAITKLDFTSETKKVSSPAAELQKMQLSFLSLRSGILALMRYVSPVIVRDVMDRGPEAVNTEMKPAHLAVLYTDLRGFTTLSEEMPHEALMAVLNKWFCEFGAVIRLHGGTIDKFIGDCIMTIFGAPEPLEEPELCACQTALCFREALQRVNTYAHDVIGVDKQYTVDYRVGIDAGTLLVGNIGFSEHINYTVCGDASHIASKLEQLGKDYLLTPLISQSVRDKVHRKLICTFVDLVTVAGTNGSPKSVTVYHIMCARAEATPAQLRVKRVFSAIHRAFISNDSATVLRLVSYALRHRNFNQYYAVLRIIEQRVQNALAGDDIRSPAREPTFL